MPTFSSILKPLSGLVFIALCAQITINLPVGETMIPVTGQTFAVLLVGYLFGIKWGMVAVVFYVLLGIMGLPIFADGKTGIEVLWGGSGGYLIGFVAGAVIAGFFSNKKPILWNALLAMTFGTIAILLFGVGRLIQLYGLEKGLAYGFYPFWKGAIIKIFLGVITVWFIERIKSVFK